MIYQGKEVGELHHLTFQCDPNQNNYSALDLFGVKKFLREHPEVDVLDFSQFCAGNNKVFTTVWYTVPRN